MMICLFQVDGHLLLDFNGCILQMIVPTQWSHTVRYRSMWEIFQVSITDIGFGSVSWTQKSVLLTLIDSLFTALDTSSIIGNGKFLVPYRVHPHCDDHFSKISDIVRFRSSICSRENNSWKRYVNLITLVSRFLLLSTPRRFEVTWTMINLSNYKTRSNEKYFSYVTNHSQKNNLEFRINFSTKRKKTNKSFIIQTQNSKCNRVFWFSVDLWNFGKELMMKCITSIIWNSIKYSRKSAKKNKRREKFQSLTRNLWFTDHLNDQRTKFSFRRLIFSFFSFKRIF